MIEINTTIFADWAALIASTADNSAGEAVITAAAGDTVTFDGIAKSVLEANQSDFHFVQSTLAATRRAFGNVSALRS